MMGDCDNCDREGVELRELDVGDGVERWCSHCLRKKGQRYHRNQQWKRRREQRVRDAK